MPPMSWFPTSVERLPDDNSSGARRQRCETSVFCIRRNSKDFNHPSLGLGDIDGILGIQGETRPRSLPEYNRHAESGNHQESLYHVMSPKRENLTSQSAREIFAL